MKANEKEKDDVCYTQPKTLQQRIVIANDFTTRFKFPLPLGVDDMTNAADSAYAAWPERLYVLDESGRISYKGGNGPFKYDPKEVRAWLAQRYGPVKSGTASSLRSISVPGRCIWEAKEVSIDLGVCKP